jgi:hypothetical protein
MMPAAAIAAVLLPTVVSLVAAPWLWQSAQRMGFAALGGHAGMLATLALARWQTGTPLGTMDGLIVSGMLAIGVCSTLLSRSGYWQPGTALGWTLAALLVMASNVGVDIERLRDTGANHGLTLLFFLAAGSATFLVQGPPARRSALWIPISFGIGLHATATEDLVTLARVLPCLGVALTGHLALLDTPNDVTHPRDSPWIPMLTFGLAATTIDASFSNTTAWGALATPLLWAPAVMALVVDRWPGVRPPVITTDLALASGLTACALAMTEPTIGWSALPFACAIVTGYVLYRT